MQTLFPTSDQMADIGKIVTPLPAVASAKEGALQAAPDLTPDPTEPDALDLTFGAPIPNEDAAWAAYNTLKAQKTKGQPLDPTAVKTWTEYRDASKAYKRELFPTQRAETQKQLAANLDIYLSAPEEIATKLPAQQAQALTGYISKLPETERPAAIARAANTAVLSQAYGKPIDPKFYTTARDHYAKEVLGLDAPDDLTFHNALREQHTTRKRAAEVVDLDATVLHGRILAGENPDLKAVTDQYRATLPPDLAESAAAELRLRTRQSRLAAKKIAPIGEVMTAFIAIEAGEKPPEPTGNKPAAPITTLGEAVARMRNLPPEDRALLMDYVGQRLKGLAEKNQTGTGQRMLAGFAGKTIEGGYSITSLLRGLYNNRLDARLDPEQKKRDQAALDEWISLTSAIKGKTEGLRSAPRSSDTWAKLSLIQSAEQLPYMITAAAGGSAGTVYNALTMAGGSFEDARNRNPDASPEAQLLTAAASGAAQAVIEQASSKFLMKSLGILPGATKDIVTKNGMESLLRVAQIRSAVTRAAVGGTLRAGSITAMELGEEVAQDATDRALQDMAALATGDQIVDNSGNASTLYQNFKNVLFSYAPGEENFKNIVLGLLPYALIGGGVGGFQNFANGHQLARNKTMLRTFGLPEAVVTEIAENPDLQKSSQLLREAITTEIQQTNTTAAQGYAQDLAEYTANLNRGARMLGQAPLIETTEDGKYLFNNPENFMEPQVFETELEAQEALYQWSQQQQDQYLGDALETLAMDEVAFLQEEGKAFDDPQFRPNLTDADGTFESMIREGLATKEQLEQRLEIFAMQEGMSLDQARAMAASGKLRIYARNYAQQVSKSSWKYVIDIFRGADPVNVREDFAEAYWKAGYDNGLFTDQEAIGWIREVENATQNRYLAENYTTENGSMPIMEALGKASIEYALHHYGSDMASPKFRQWVETMLQALGSAWKWFKTMARGMDLQDAIESKQVPQKFADLLADSVGMNEEMRNQRMEKREQENARAEFLGDFPKLSERIKGKLLHPARAEQNSNPLARELRRIYEGLSTSKRTFVSTIDRRWHTYVAKAEAFFADRKENVNLDRLRESLNEEGFQFDTIDEMLEAVNDSLFYGREHYATHSGLATQSDQSFSLAPTDQSNQSDSSFPLDKTPNPQQSFDHANRRRLSDPTNTARPPGKGEKRSQEEIRSLIGRAKAAKGKGNLREGQESSVVALDENAVLKQILPKGLWAYTPDGKLIRTNDAALLADKVEAIRALDGLQTEAFEHGGELYIYQERGEPITDDEFASLELPFNIKPSLGNTYRILVNGKTFLVSDLHKDNFIKDSKGVIRVADLIASEVKAQATPLADINTSSFSLAPDVQVNLETIIAARLARGPAERIAALETMRQRIQSAVYKAERRGAGDLTDMEKQLLGWRGKGELTPAQRERLRIEDALASVKAIISALPTEIRHAVNVPLTRILDAETSQQTTNAFKELIQEADAALEQHLQDLYLERIGAILDTARPTADEKRTNRTLLTPDTQELIDDIADVVAMTPENLMAAEAAAEAKLQALTDSLDSLRADPTTEPQDLAQAEMNLARHTAHMQHLATFGNLPKQSASEMAGAFRMLEDTYTRGRTARKIIDQSNRLDIYGNRQEIAHALGKPNGVTGPEYDRATAATVKKSALWRTKALALETVSWFETLAVLLPNSLTAATWAKRALRAIRATRRRRLDAEARWETFRKAQLGVTSRRQYYALLKKLSTRRSLKTKIAEVAEIKVEKIPVEKIPDILNGKLKFGWTADRYAMDQLREAWRDFQLLPKKKRARMQTLKVQVISTRKAPQPAFLSDLEILDILQTHAQEGYRAQLDKYGYTEEAITSLRQEIAPEALKIGEFLRTEYDNGWYELNPTFQRIYQMNMPRIHNYAPGSFHSFTDSPGAGGSPMGTQQGTATTMSPGFAKNRRAHMARLQTSNALQKYWAHVEATSYWIEWAELSKEMAATLRAPETKRTIEATHGKPVAEKLYQWLDRINNDGINKAQAILETDHLMSRMMNARSASVLAWNLGVPFKQFSAMLSSMTYVPARSALKSFARMMNPETWATMKTLFQSEAIQQRIRDGFSPELRALLDASKTNPSQLIDLINMGRMPTQYADAAFTTVSAFIAYDFHYQQEIKTGISKERAHQLAMQAMDETILLTAQPVDTTTKSLIETNGGAMWKLFTQFKSDQRRAIGNIITVLWQNQQGTKTKGDVARVIATQWLTYGLLGAIGTAMFKTLAHDDDDDENYWSIDRLITGVMLGPIEGLVLIGDVFGWAIRKVMDQKTYDNEANLLSSSTADVVNQFTSDKPIRWGSLTTALATVAGGLGLPEAAIVPALLKAGTQLTNMADNAITTDEEKLAQIAKDYDATVKEQKTTTEDTFQETLTQLIAADPQAREAMLAAMDTQQRARARKAIDAATMRKDMTPLEVDLHRMGAKAREAKARYLYQQIPDADDKATFALRIRDLFQLDVTTPPQ